jgi:hypothetical protein
MLDSGGYAGEARWRITPSANPPYELPATLRARKNSCSSMHREIFPKFGALYRTIIVFLFKLISLLMIAVGVLIALLILADKMLHLGWGYPWWALLFCALYIGVSISIYRSIPSAITYLDKRIDRTPTDHRRPPSG